MASKKTWLWILAAGFGLTVFALAALAGLSLYFVASHIDTGRTSDADALRAFDEVRAGFPEERPLFELDSRGTPRPTTDLALLPPSGRRAEHLWILVWNPDDTRLSKISLPFWVLRLGRQNIEIQHDSGFDLNELDLDVDELERVGPKLIFDFRTTDGERILVWTQ